MGRASFRLEIGEALLSAAFERDFREVVVAPTAGPIIAYIESLSGEHVREHGEFAVTANSGVFQCW